MANRQELERQARFMALMNDPTSLFPGVRTTLWPNGDNKIWFHDTKGNGSGLSVAASSGPHGFGLEIDTFSCSLPLTISGNDADWKPVKQFDAKRISVTMYRSDVKAQSYKAWHDTDSDPNADLDCFHGERYRLNYTEGRGAAKLGQPLPESFDQLSVQDANAWKRGYYAQKAGLHDKD